MTMHGLFILTSDSVVRSGRGSDGDFWGLVIALGIFLVLLTIGLLVGGTVERRHLASIKARLESLRNMLVTDIKTFPAADASRPGGKVFVSEVVISTDYLKTFLAALRNIFGGEVRSFETLLIRARDEARLRIMEQARAEGFNALCNLRLYTADLSGRSEQRKRKIIAVGVIASATGYHAAQS